MNITILVDNNPCVDNPRLQTEHGLSVYIEACGNKLLLDTGASDRFFSNAETMGINISEVDFLILSHAHNDHTGGLECFLQHNKRARIVCSSHINNQSYASTRRGGKRDISIDYALLASCGERFLMVDDKRTISEGVVAFGDIAVVYPLPKANRTLLHGDVCDDFRHEIAILIQEHGHKVLFSSCTHKGLLNTLAASPVLPDVFVGGLHLIDSDEDNEYETEDEYQKMCGQINARMPGVQLYTGHCTGNRAFKTLREKLGNRIKQFHTGFHLSV